MGYDASGTFDRYTEPRAPSANLSGSPVDSRTNKSINLVHALGKSLREDFVPQRLHNDLKELNDFLLRWYRADKFHDFESSTDNSGEYVYDPFEHLLYGNIVKDARKEELLRKFMPFILSVRE